MGFIILLFLCGWALTTDDPDLRKRRIGVLVAITLFGLVVRLFG